MALCDPQMTNVHWEVIHCLTDEDTTKKYQCQSNFPVGNSSIYSEMNGMSPTGCNKIKTSSEELFILDHKKYRYFNSYASGRLTKLFKFVIEDWVYLALLGLIMAICSFIMDVTIDQLQMWHTNLYDQFKNNPSWILSYIVWVLYIVMLTSASALCAHYIAPQAIGSGIPEMKTILRGVILKEYLTLRTLISKMVALTLSLGSGLPIGKEGPFVHVASVVANLLTSLVHGSQGVYKNESRSSEMLVAGCAVGVACTFSAPVGGVLFSIEVTSVYFAVRNYWRGFFAATCGATLFRMLKMLQKASIDKDMTNLNSILSVEAHYQTHFQPKDAFLPFEFIAFAFVGLMCGLGGAGYIYCHRNVVLFLRRNSLAKKLFQKYWLLYPVVISFIISSITYPSGFGIYIGGEQRFSRTLQDFFIDCTWSVSANHSSACPLPSSNPKVLFDIRHWIGPDQSISIFHSLVVFQITFFFLSIFATTLPVPAGTFMPVFVLGAAFGRTIGELLATWYPNGLHNGLPTVLIHPGVYAVVGAAAFCGSVTHTVSVAVIVFELTGQLIHLLPVMIAVLIANAVCSYLQPSIYDSIIKIKHLPYLPNIPNTSSIFHQIYAEQFMISPVRYIGRDSTYGELQELLLDMPRLRAFPLVENRNSLALLGSISRLQLHRLLELKVGTKARQCEATRRVKDAIDNVGKRFRIAETNETTGKIEEKTNKSRFTIVPVSPVAFTNSKVSVPETDHIANQAVILKDTFNNSLPATNILSENPIFAMGKKRNRLEEHQNTLDSYPTIGGMFRSITRLSFGRHKKYHRDNDFDLHGDERKAWESDVLNSALDLSDIQIDPAPFQLVEHTSLFKVHSLFSLLGLSRAYVTKCGKLVGVVALKELRIAIESAQSGSLPMNGKSVFDGIRKKRVEESKNEDYIHPRLEILNRGSTINGMDRTIHHQVAYALLDEEIPEVMNRNSEKKLSEENDQKISTSNSDSCLLGKISGSHIRHSTTKQLKVTSASTTRLNRGKCFTGTRSISPHCVFLNISKESSETEDLTGDKYRKIGRHVTIMMPEDTNLLTESEQLDK